MILHENTWGGLRHPGERRTENGEQNAPAGRPTNLHPKALLRAHPLRFCDFLGKALKAPQEMQAPQEIQEIQEIQERPCGATDKHSQGFIRRALAARSVLRSPFSVLRFPLFFAFIIIGTVVRGALESVTWGVDPAAPIYVGQEYDLTLTFVMNADEEIPAFRITQGPSRNPDSQTRTERNGKRLTVFRWRQRENAPRLAAIPVARVAAEVTRVQRFGLQTFAQTFTQGAQVPAFSYDVVPLPGEAAGAPIGNFELALTADAADFVPGDVRVLTATLTARSGALPETPELALESVTGVRLWPFRVVAREPNRVVARGYLATEAPAPLTLRLKPLRAFDLESRTLRDVTCPPLTLTPRAEAAESGPVPVRLAPSMRAAVLGTHEGTPEPTGETAPGWVRVRVGGLTGWIPEGAAMPPRRTENGEQNAPAGRQAKP